MKFFQSRKWPDLNLKSPGIKPRTLAGRSHPPQPLPAVTPHLVPPTSSPRPFSDDGGGEETPRTPLTAPHTPPAGHLGDYSVCLLYTSVLKQSHVMKFFVNFTKCTLQKTNYK